MGSISLSLSLSHVGTNKRGSARYISGGSIHIASIVGALHTMQFLFLAEGVPAVLLCDAALPLPRAAAMESSLLSASKDKHNTGLARAQHNSHHTGIGRAKNNSPIGP